MKPLLPYNSQVNGFGRKILTTGTGQITYEEAFKNSDYVDKALLVSTTTNVPIEFTMFVLHKMAVNKKTVHKFERALPSQAHEYLKKLIGSNRITYRDVHDRYKKTETPSTFREEFVKVFCKKVMTNSQNLQDTNYDKLAAMFPFQICRSLEGQFKIEVLNVLSDNFYNKIQQFLNEHFENLDAHSICVQFLGNIHHFMETKFSVETLYSRSENIVDRNYSDYLSNFPRLNETGIKWFKFLYQEMRNVRQCFGFHAMMLYEQNDDEYFQFLPENNFVELFSLLDCKEYFRCRNILYTHRFKKYLFFFVHALQVDHNPVFFIDDMLFDCLKSLRRYKTLHEDIDMVKDLAKISLLNFRLDPSKGGSAGRYHMSASTLKIIKEYLLKSIIPGKPRLNVEYKTNLLTFMLFRTVDICFEVEYSRLGYRQMKSLIAPILCSVLCPDDDPIRYIVSYNAFLGIETRLTMPQNVESIRNFIRLCNTFDVTDEQSLETPKDHFLKNFDHLIKTELNVELLDIYRFIY